MQTAVVRWPDLDRRLSYRPSWGRDGLCRVRVWHAEEVVVVTELDENPGPSVTNAIESIADQLQVVLDVQVGTDTGYLLVEHYEAGRSWREATFDVVRFLVVEGRTHTAPLWRPMGDALPELRAALQHPSMLNP